MVSHRAGCGNPNHIRETCRLQDHPEFNKHGQWRGSKIQKRCKNAGRQHLPATKLISGAAFEQFAAEKAARAAAYERRNSSDTARQPARGSRGPRGNNRGEILQQNASLFNSGM